MESKPASKLQFLCAKSRTRRQVEFGRQSKRGIDCFTLLDPSVTSARSQRDGSKAVNNPDIERMNSDGGKSLDSSGCPRNRPLIRIPSACAQRYDRVSFVSSSKMQNLHHGTRSSCHSYRGRRFEKQNTWTGKSILKSENEPIGIDS